MSDRQAEIRRLRVQLQDEKRQKLTAQRILRAAQEEHRLDVDDLETRLCHTVRYAPQTLNAQRTPNLTPSIGTLIN